MLLFDGLSLHVPFLYILFDGHKGGGVEGRKRRRRI